MYVWNNGWYTKDLIDVTSYSAEIFISKIAVYFEDKDYGRDVKEIFYIEVCESPIYTKNPAGDVLHYDKHKRMVEVGLYLDFEIVSNLNGPQFCRYLANKYLERSLDIDELKEIKDFNLNEYIKDLEAFFVLNSVL